MTAAVVLNWSKNDVGRPAKCLYCSGKALMRDESGKPTHKVCAEQAATTTAQRLGTTKGTLDDN